MVENNPSTRTRIITCFSRVRTKELLSPFGWIELLPGTTVYIYEMRIAVCLVYPDTTELCYKYHYSSGRFVFYCCIYCTHFMAEKTFHVRHVRKENGNVLPHWGKCNKN